MAAVGLHCCMWAFSSCSELWLRFVGVCGLLIAVASLVVEHRLQTSVIVAQRLCSCVTWASVVVAWHVESSQTRDQTCAPCMGINFYSLF